MQIGTLLLAMFYCVLCMNIHQPKKDRQFSVCLTNVEHHLQIWLQQQFGHIWKIYNTQILFQFQMVKKRRSERVRERERDRNCNYFPIKPNECIIIDADSMDEWWMDWNLVNCFVMAPLWPATKWYAAQLQIFVVSNPINYWTITRVNWTSCVFYMNHSIHLVARHADTLFSGLIISCVSNCTRFTITRIN